MAREAEGLKKAVRLIAELKSEFIKNYERFQRNSIRRMNLQAERGCGADYFFIDVRSRSMSAVRIVVKIQPPEMTNMPTHPLLENGSGSREIGRASCRERV